jgi:hypothetical protein
VVEELGLDLLEGLGARPRDSFDEVANATRPRGAAWAGVVAIELLDQLLRAADDTSTAPDARLRRDALASLARDLESTRSLR